MKIKKKKIIGVVALLCLVVDDVRLMAKKARGMPLRTPLSRKVSLVASSETNKTIRAFLLVLTHSPAGETVQITCGYPHYKGRK